MGFSLIIPARYKSTRFPGKPLTPILGKPLIYHVIDKASEVIKKNEIYIATDDDRIKDAVKEYGYNVVMTSSNCLTGTDRVAEASKSIESKYFINLQGDEPLIDSQDLIKAKNKKIEFPNHVINGYTEIKENELVDHTSIPKVVINEKEELIYMSRSRIPGSKNKNVNYKYLKQVCIYAFSKEELNLYYDFKKKSMTESIEDIEILRFFDLNVKIKMFRTSNSSLAVDHPEDVKIVENFINNLNK